MGQGFFSICIPWTSSLRHRSKERDETSFKQGQIFFRSPSNGDGPGGGEAPNLFETCLKCCPDSKCVCPSKPVDISICFTPLHSFVQFGRPSDKRYGREVVGVVLWKLWKKMHDIMGENNCTAPSVKWAFSSVTVFCRHWPFLYVSRKKPLK